MFGLPSIRDCCHWLADHMGMWWPDADPGKCRKAADAWRAFAKAVDDVTTPTNNASTSLIHHNKGEAVDAYAQFWARYHGGHGKGWLDDVSATSNNMAEALDKYADAIDHAITKIEERIGIDIAVLAAAILIAAGSGGTLSGPAAGVAAEVIELAGGLGLVVGGVAEEVLTAAIASAFIGGVESVVVDLAVAQPLQIAAGLQHDSLNLDELSSAAKDGMIGGALFGGAGGAGKAAANAAADAGGFRALLADMPSLLRMPSGLTTDLDDLGALAKSGKPPVVDVPSEPEVPPKGSIRPGDAEAPAASRNTNSVECRTDPVDIATGVMLLPQTDVELPGQLPLLFERTHLSSYRAGGWFGPTWASTLDERLQLDARGVVFAAADGKLLTYPVPEPGQPVLPERGPQMPLVWDGRADGVMTISDPATGLVRTFSRPAAKDPQDTIDLLLDSIEDRNGNRIDFDRAPSGAPVAMQHSGGYHIAIEAHGPRITALHLTDSGADRYAPAGDSGGTVLVRYGYDDAGNLIEVVNSSGTPLRFGYDADGHITSWTDRNGTSYAYVYDERGRVMRTEGSDNFMSATFTYDDETRTTRFTNSLGESSVYRCNAQCRVVAETDPLGHTTLTEWDPTGQHRLAVTDPLGRTTRYAYDTSGNLTSVTLPDGTTGHATYNALNLPTEVTEPGGAAWHHTYDDAGNLLTTTDPTGAETRYTYTGSGHLATVTDALGHAQHITCDASGLPTSITDALGHTTTVRRDAFGRIIEVTDPLGHATRMGWTTEGKPKWRELPDGARESWEWDGEGNLLSHTDPVGNTTSYTSTHFDLPVSRTDPDGTVYGFTYDTELRLTGVTNPQGLTWSYTYDAAGRLTAETDFDGRTLSYVHDAAGQLTSRVNGAGETLAFTRDAVGRTTATTTDAGTQTTFTYDADGHLIRAANRDAEVVWQRDALSRVLAETTNGRTIAYTYDALGRTTQRTTPGGAVSRWTYDPAGRPTQLQTNAGSLDFAYDAAGRETERRLGEDVRLTQGWDSADRLTTQALTHADSGETVILQHRAYAYRLDGLLAEVRELASGTRRFDLDKAGRVTAVTAHGWRETYAYDEAGNLTHATAPAHPTAGDREFTGTLIRSAGRTTYEHDAQGRLTRKTRKLLNGQHRSWQFTWNTEDRLTDARTPDGEHWHYTYDPLGRRTAKQRLADGAIAEETTFTWDGTRVAEQTITRGPTTTWDYAPGTHRPIAQTHRDQSTDPSLVARLDDPVGFHAVVTDLTGTPTELVSPNGTITWQTRTTLWGTPLPAPVQDSGGVHCPLRFPGQYQDRETGLHYNLHRYYDPQTARYLSPDPLGLTPAPNPATYVHNPTTLIDPLGLAPCPGAEDNTPASNPASPTYHVALGLKAEGTYSWAEKQKYMHFGGYAPDAWQGPVETAIRDPSVHLHVNLKGLGNFVDAAKAGLQPGAYATDTEMGWIARAVANGERSWSSISFYRPNANGVLEGVPVAEPDWSSFGRLRPFISDPGKFRGH